MSDVAPFLKELQASLDAIEAALISQDADSTAALCLQLQQLLASQSKQSPSGGYEKPADLSAIASIDRRMKAVRAALAQQSASAQRSLSTLLPDHSVSTYGGKTGFGSAQRGPNLKSYQA